MRRCFTLVELMIVLAIIAIVTAIAIPNLYESRKAANELAAVTALRTIFSAQALYRERSEANHHGDLGDLAAAHLLDGPLAGGSQSGFEFIVIPGNDLDNTGGTSPNPSQLFFVRGSPVVFGATGDRAFYTDQGGAVFVTLGVELLPEEDIRSQAKPYSTK